MRHILVCLCCFECVQEMCMHAWLSKCACVWRRLRVEWTEMQTHSCDKPVVQCYCCPGTGAFAQKINATAVLVLVGNATYG